MKAVFFALLLACSATLSAKDQSVTATAKAVVKAAATAVVSAAEAAPAVVAEGAKASQQIDWPVIIKSSATTHRHSKVVHFPIALGLVGVLFALLAYRFESFRSGSRWLLFLGAVSAVVAILTGSAEEDTVDAAAHQVLEAHELQGYIVGVLLWLNWLLSFVESTRKWNWILLLMLAAALSGAGMLGGALAHMQF